MKAMAVVVLVLLLLAPPAVSQVVPDDKLIVPGVRIGKWTLDMTIQQLVQMNGRPSTVDRAGGADHVPPAPQRYIWDRLAFFAITRDGQKVQNFLIGDEAFKTEKNVGPGSTRVSVQNAYGTPTAETTVTADGRTTRMIYDAIGFAAVIDGGVAISVNIFRAGDAKTIWRF